MESLSGIYNVVIESKAVKIFLRLLTLGCSRNVEEIFNYIISNAFLRFVLKITRKKNIGIYFVSILILYPKRIIIYLFLLRCVV